MKTFARLTFDSVRFDQPASAHLVIGLIAPSIDWQAKRPPVCVIPVIDVSGSMQGDKLQQAKQSVLKLIDHLGPRDRCGVVTFSTEVTVVSPPMELSPVGKADLKLKVGNLKARSCTNLSGGMLAGLELGNLPDLPKGMLVRVILFTDGCANHGVATTSAELLPRLDANRGRTTVSAFGYGLDADQELLADLAKRGGGNYAFVSGPDAAMTAFARELGSLLSTYAEALEVTVTPRGGARITSVLSDVEATQRGRDLVLRMDDILAEEERHLVLEVELPVVPAPAHGPVFDVTGRYKRLDGTRTQAQTFAERVGVDRCEPSKAQPRPDPALDVIVAQAELLRAQLDAEAQARSGDFGNAVIGLVGLALRLEARGHVGVAIAAGALAEKMRDGGTFSGSAAHRKSMKAGLERGASGSKDAEAEAALKAMGKKLRTMAQDEMARSFGAPAPANETPPKADGDSSPSSSGSPPSKATLRRSRRW